MIRMITLILPLCCLFNTERHELARGIYITREVYIAMFVIRIIQLTIAFNNSYHTCMNLQSGQKMYLVMLQGE